MKKLFYILLLFSFVAQSQVKFSFDDKDKHVITGALISSHAQLATYAISKNKNIMLSGWVGTSVGFLAGLGKEFYDDRKQPGTFNPIDLMATGYGSLLGVLVLSVPIDIVQNKKRALHPEQYESLTK